MNYGLSSWNDSNYLQISSDSPRLCVLYEGNYTGQSFAQVFFPVPITTPEPPCIFIRPTNAPTIMHRGMVISGGPGNWTGFYMRLSNVNAIASGTWFVAVYRSTVPSSYGMRLWDENGVEIYDTASPAVIVSAGAHTWTYAGRLQLVSGNAYYWRCPISIPFKSNDHFMINPFSRYLMTTHSYNAIWMGVTMDIPNNQLLMYAVGVTVPYGPIGAMASVIARARK